MQKHVTSHSLPAPGFPCPQCGVRIVLTIPMLLNQGEVYCGVCGLELVINQEKSKAGLDELKQVQDSHDEVINSN